ncbi:acyltransferase [Paraglaciecola sp. L1A13]|uniref:acyltransferase family protein n=1 Tax=Paraglaciecola sp. L1A13 TaxID=2686359 RepID=UPI00131E98CE|nr:acyltransferase [Paraglaciecola sp. L1A13]
MNRNIALDVLKLIMAFMVVGIHANFMMDLSPLGNYLTVHGMFRIAVPVFFVINGYFFYYVLIKEQQLKWLRRVFILYITWMVFYSYFWFSIPDMSFISYAKLLKVVFFGYYHLWYIAGMIGAAVILLILRKLPSSILIISIILTFLSGVIIQYLGNYHIFEGTFLDKLFNTNQMHRNMIFLAYPFFCTGYLINKHSLPSKISLEHSFILSILAIGALLGESYFNFLQENRDGYFDNYFSLILICPIIFILFIKANIPGTNRNIALYSSSIYFIHVLILIILQKITALSPTYVMLFTILLSAFVSYFIIKINKRLKFIL